MESVSFKRPRAQAAFQAAALAMVPLAFFLVTARLTKVTGPTWLSDNYEHNYSYLFSSLRLLDGAPLVYLDHPGVTTAIFGAAVLGAEGGAREIITERVLNDPDRAIKVMQRAQLILTVLALWIGPWLTSVYAGRWAIGLLLQLPCLFFATTLRYTAEFSSDATVIPVSIIGFCFVVLLLYQRRKGAQPLWSIAGAGLVAGLGMATKLDFFPVVILLLAFCLGFKNRVVFAGAMVLTLAVVLIPAYPNLGHLASWNIAVLTHTGTYGTGASGFIQSDILWAGIRRMLTEEPSIGWVPLLATIATLGLVLAGRIQGVVSVHKGIAQTALVLFGLQMVGFLMVAKHAGPHYLIPLYHSLGLNLIIWYEAAIANRNAAPVFLCGMASLCLMVGWALKDCAYTTSRLYQIFNIARKELVAFYHRTETLTRGELRLDYSRASSPEFAVWSGDEENDRYFGPRLQKRFPNALCCVLEGDDGDSNPNLKFSTYTQDLDPAVVLQGRDRLYLFGNHSDGRGIPGVALKIPGLDGKDINKVGQSGLYCFPNYLEEWVRPSDERHTAFAGHTVRFTIVNH
jgi:hypothetical protein